MGGFVVDLGRPHRSEIEAMLEKIRHRGPDAFGTCEANSIMVAQNYVKADGAVSDGDFEIPVQGSSNPRLRICYDGQMGDWEDVAIRRAISDGPFREERLLMEMYQQYGKGMVQYLNDTIFAFVIAHGDEIFAARDALGIKTMF